MNFERNKYNNLPSFVTEAFKAEHDIICEYIVGNILDVGGSGRIIPAILDSHHSVSSYSMVEPDVPNILDATETYHEMISRRCISAAFYPSTFYDFIKKYKRNDQNYDVVMCTGNTISAMNTDFRRTMKYLGSIANQFLIITAISNGYLPQRIKYYNKSDIPYAVIDVELEIIESPVWGINRGYDLKDFKKVQIRGMRIHKLFNLTDYMICAIYVRDFI